MTTIIEIKVLNGEDKYGSQIDITGMSDVDVKKTVDSMAGMVLRTLQAIRGEKA